MEKYELVKQQKLEKLTSNPISVIEYVMYYEIANHNKLLVLKLSNQSPFNMVDTEIQIDQFDDKNNMIQSDVHLFKELYFNTNYESIPNEKIIIDDQCQIIKVKIISLKCARGKWQDGEWDFEFMDEKIVLDESLVDLESIKHKKITLPYAISFSFLLLFVVIILSVYKALN